MLVEKSLLGWKEYELEVMRDLADNVVIVCSIENIDPMGVHTGDSITIAPAQTLTDKEYQRLRDASVKMIREIGVECGGCNVQFGINPVDGELMVIEMNPRVSRSSALASKATGFPIAKFATKLAVGLTLDEISNDITLKTPASFEPSIDYVVTKIPRFAFEKFPGATPTLTTQMKSVGEAMAIGRTFQESFQKALRSLETDLPGWAPPVGKPEYSTGNSLEHDLRVPHPMRLLSVRRAMVEGMSRERLFELTAYDPWFLQQFGELMDIERWARESVGSLDRLGAAELRDIKRHGFSDKQVASWLGATEAEARARRLALGVEPGFKRVDTCAAEFEAFTPYLYSSYDEGCESAPEARRKVLIVGGGPNRIGQGIEFDYCCCHAAFALRDRGFETIMMNSNPETVSTDYDTSDRLYFEPLTVEDVLAVVRKERPDGIIVQFGGQTPLKLAGSLERELRENPVPALSGDGDVRIWGTSPESIDRAEDREKFDEVLSKLGIVRPPGGVARSEAEAEEVCAELGFPVMVRPSYVLGGRAMEIVYSGEDLRRYITTAVEVDPEHPVLVDKYLSDAVEIDVDALTDGNGDTVICGIMEHIEQAGVHSGDSACSLPTQTVGPGPLDDIRAWTTALARELGVCGLLNMQYAVKGDQAYLLEANPRASRTVPFVSKAIGHPLAQYASRVMAGETLADVGLTAEPVLAHVAVKEAVLPFEKFPGADTILGPEMRSTGEVMGIDASFDAAYAKAQLAAGQQIPTAGTVFVSMNDMSKADIVPVARGFADLGFRVVATGGTAEYLTREGVGVERVLKVHEGRPNVSDMVRDGEASLMLITSSGDAADSVDGKQLRRLALGLKVPLVTTIAGSRATLEAIRGLKSSELDISPLQHFLDS